MPVLKRSGNLWGHVQPGDYVVQSNNCFCAWGAGFARSAKQNLPNGWAADSASSRALKSKLGNIVVTPESSGVVGVTMYTQYFWGRDRVRAEYWALNTCLWQLSGVVPVTSRILMPKISCNNAGAQWPHIEWMLNQYFPNHTVVVFN